MLTESFEMYSNKTKKKDVRIVFFSSEFEGLGCVLPLWVERGLKIT